MESNSLALSLAPRDETTYRSCSGVPSDRSGALRGSRDVGVWPDVGHNHRCFDDFTGF